MGRRRQAPRAACTDPVDGVALGDRVDLPPPANRMDRMGPKLARPEPRGGPAESQDPPPPAGTPGWAGSAEWTEWVGWDDASRPGSPSPETRIA
ncbi:hypothetical protein NJB1507_24210 [Mycobacterium marinum]|nr:hypothetical protein NJB1507_24210 [Mycobacterium marinum]